MIRRNLRHIPKRYPTWAVLQVLSQVGYFCDITHLTPSDKKLGITAEVSCFVIEQICSSKIKNQFRYPEGIFFCVASHLHHSDDKLPFHNVILSGTEWSYSSEDELKDLLVI